jgi:protein-disulfide isomerase
MLCIVNDCEMSTCTRKVTYKSKLEAEVYGLSMYGTLKKFMVYQCQFCKDWHISTKEKYINERS